MNLILDDISLFSVQFILSLILVIIFYAYSSERKYIREFILAFYLPGYCVVLYQNNVLKFINIILFLSSIILFIYILYLDRQIETIIYQINIPESDTDLLEDRYKLIYENGTAIMKYISYTFPFSAITLLWDIFINKYINNHLRMMAMLNK